MPRRRSANPTTAISITIPRTLLDEIDNQLTRTQSRSAWIANASHIYMHHQYDINIPSKQLFAMVHARLPEGVLKNLIFEHITSLDHDANP